MSYRRKIGQVHTKRLHRKIRLGFRHIFLSFTLVLVFFLVLHQVFLFAMTWDKLDIQNIYISCENDSIRADVQRLTAGYSFGNILLYDSRELEEKIEAFSRIKSVSIRKLFPLSLNISIDERKPFAVIEKEFLAVIDAEGVVIGRINTSQTQLPLFIDQNEFKDYYEEKIDFARKFLEIIPVEERSHIEILDLSEAMNIKAKLKGSLTWLVLGGSRFEENLRRFRSEKNYLEGYGNLEYVDLRFEDRFFIKPLKDLDIPEEIATAKEAN